MLVKQLLLADNFWVLNKTIVKILGLETAFFLSNLAEAENMFADDDGWFFQTIETVQEKTTLSRRKQDTAVKELTKLNILLLQNKGLPKKRYFKLNYEALNDLIFKQKQQSVRNEQTVMCKTNKIKSTKRTDSNVQNEQTVMCKTHNNKELIINNEYKEKEIDKEIDHSIPFSNFEIIKQGLELLSIETTNQNINSIMKYSIDEFRSTIKYMINNSKTKNIQILLAILRDRDYEKVQKANNFNNNSTEKKVSSRQEKVDYMKIKLGDKVEAVRQHYISKYSVEGYTKEFASKASIVDVENWLIAEYNKEAKK